MVDPYQSKMAAQVRFVDKRPVRASVVAVLEGTIENRGLELIHPASRCVRRGEIFELICTAEPSAKPGGRVERATYLGFCEVQQAGVIRVGDAVTLCGRFLGKVAGFDETHAPNHENIVVGVAPEMIPPPIRYALEDEVSFIHEYA